MIIVPRSYQIECVDSIFNYFAAKGPEAGNPVCALPTGTGKSIVIAMLLQKIFQHWPTQKVLVATHVKELIQQNYQKLLYLWPTAPAGVNSAGLNRRDTANNIIFCGIASVRNYAASFGHVDLMLIDEAHLVSPNDETMYRQFIEDLKLVNPALKVVGFTATPWRLGHGHITEDGGLFTDVAFDITGLEAFNRLIAEGFVCPLIPKQPETMLDVDGVHMRGGDFIQSELQYAVDKYDITVRALKEALRSAPDRKHWLIFASGVEHADHIADILKELGEPCHSIHSKISSKQRDDRIADFKAGRIRAVVNNNVLTTGFDFPAIDLILMLRPTASPVLWVQMLGRGTRPSYDTGKKNCMVLDFAGNTRRLGPINDPVVPHKKGKKGGTPPIKLCEACGTLNHASVKFCIFCGAEFHFQTKLKDYASSEELIKGELPITEVFNIDHVTVRQHEKIGKKPAMKVTYYAGYQKFDEYICFEHEGFAARKARAWWKDRAFSQLYETGVPIPQTTLQALDYVEYLQTPSHIRVWTNKKYPEILAYCFDGSAFGSQVVSETFSSPAIQVESVKKHSTTKIDDDDIPF